VKKTYVKPKIQKQEPLVEVIQGAPVILTSGAAPQSPRPIS
jgi:hypothetical protein